MSGALCISVDLELAWGFWDKPSPEQHRLCAEKERAIVAALLDLLAEREIAATWVIVGSLLDATAKPPVDTAFGRRIWYAPELVEAIREASPLQDVGSHGFAHLYFRQTDRERLRADLQAARRVHDAHGLDFTSFVFPRNQIAHLDLLAEAGVRVFRGDDVGWFTTVRER
ncbi:MAG TPA: polysaccharide deacetylase family protein, partial [Anaeromyxobacteraceae bacterium]|nr:polysaccharide deacetylase family protein [Anaeromyxobacteraceae bacterium]